MMKKKLLWMIILFPMLTTSCKDEFVDNIDKEIKETTSKVETANPVKPITISTKRKDKDWETSVGN